LWCASSLMHSDRHISDARDLTSSWDKLSFVLRMASRIRFVCVSKASNRLDNERRVASIFPLARLAERWQYMSSKAPTYPILSNNRGVKDALRVDNLSLNAKISFFDHAVLIVALRVCHT
jgi:hypothetical protein